VELAVSMSGVGRGRGAGRGRPAHEVTAETGKARFVRDEHGELVVVKPGERAPGEIDDEDKDAEQLQYEAYLAGKSRGAVSKIGGYSDGVDRAAFADSAAAREAEGSADQSGEKRKYAPAQAYNRSSKYKKSASGQSQGEASADGIRKMREAMQRAREASDDDDDDDDDAAAADMNAEQLADSSMKVYNTPIAKMAQLDVHGNDLRLPQLERKMRKFIECFAEDMAVRTVQGQTVLKDLDAFRKRYSTVFRESGVGLRGEVRKRFVFTPQGGGQTFCLNFELHSELVTPRPGLALDGSMGVLPPRSQELVVLYEASGSEITGMWISQDEKHVGGDAALSRAALEESEVFGAFHRRIQEQCDGAELEVQYASFL